MNKRLTKKNGKKNAAYVFAAMIQSIAFGWSGEIEISADDSADFVNAVYNCDDEIAVEIVNNYISELNTITIMNGKARKWDLAIPPKFLVKALDGNIKCLKSNNKCGWCYVATIDTDRMLEEWADHYHDRFINEEGEIIY